MTAPTRSVFGYISLPRGLAHRTLKGVKVDRVWYNYTVASYRLDSPMGLVVGLQASAGRGSSPPTCIVLYCIVLYCIVLLITFMSEQLGPGISGSADEHIPQTLLSKL